MKFIDHETGIVVGDKSTIFKSVDGGITWQPKDCGIPNHDFFSLSIPAPGAVYICGAFSLVLKSVDLGETMWISAIYSGECIFSEFLPERNAGSGK